MSADINGLSRRAFMAAGSAFGLSLFAQPAVAQDIGPSPIDLPAPRGPLRWLDSGDQKGVFFKKFFAQYGKARNIEVVYDGLPWSEIATVLPLGIRNGTAPDAFNLPFGMPPSVAVAEGWVRPFDDVIPGFEAWRAGFPKGSFIEGVNVIKGKTYGLPFTSDRRCASLLLFGRKAMALSEFNPGPDAPLTWDQFRKAADQITKVSKRRTPGLIIGGAQTSGWALAVMHLAQRAGAACGTIGIGTGLDYRTGEIVVNSDEFVGAVELLLAIRNDGSFFPGALSLTAPQARAFVAQGNSGMILQGPWNVPIWETSNPDFDFGFTYTPAPDGKNGKTIIDALPAASNMMFINAAAKNPLYAADVLRYMGTLEGQIAWANVVGPADPAIFPQAFERANLSPRARGIITLQADQVRTAPVPYSKNAGFVTVARFYKEPTPNLAQTVQGLFSGQLTGVKEKLTKLKDAMNAALDKAIAQANAEGVTVSRADLVFPDWNPAEDYV